VVPQVCVRTRSMSTRPVGSHDEYGGGSEYRGIASTARDSARPIR